MSQIAEYVRDPAWWFTAVFVAIISSLFASYLRDLLSRAASLVSKTSRERAARRERAFESRVDRLASDPTQLLYETVRAVGGVVVLSSLMGLSLLLALYLFGPLPPPTTGLQLKARFAVVLFPSILAITAGQTYSNTLRILRAAATRYREQHPVPPAA